VFYKKSLGQVVFDVMNYTVLIGAALLCLLPFVNLIALSFSDKIAILQGQVTFWPVGFNLKAYEYIFHTGTFFRAFGMSVIRVLLGVSIQLSMIVLTAYPLSKNDAIFKARKFYVWIFFLSMIFSTSLIPNFLVVYNLGLVNTIWALVLPGMLPVFSMVIMLNFFRGLPHELEEAAMIDGAGHLRILVQIYLPLSKPSIATVGLFCIVGHWNAWFDGMLYMNSSDKWPLQTYLQTIVVRPETLMGVNSASPELARLIASLNNRSARAAQLFVAILPILAVYPFLQKYFTKGLVIGSVKG